MSLFSGLTPCAPGGSKSSPCTITCSASSRKYFSCTIRASATPKPWRARFAARLTSWGSEVGTVLAARDFAEQRQGVAVGVVELGQPDLAVGQPRHQVGLLIEGHSAPDQRVVSGVDVLHAVVEDGARVCAAGGRGRPLPEQQADAAAVEEGHARGRLEEELHRQGVAVEGDGALEVADGEGNLPELRQSEGFRWAHGTSLSVVPGYSFQSDTL